MGTMNEIEIWLAYIECFYWKPKQNNMIWSHQLQLSPAQKKTKYFNHLWYFTYEFLVLCILGYNAEW